MASSFPALDIKQPEGPLDQYAKVMQIKAGFLGQQLTTQEIKNSALRGQQMELEVQGQRSLVAAQHDSDWDASDLQKTQKLFDKYDVPPAARTPYWNSVKDFNAAKQQEIQQFGENYKQHAQIVSAAQDKLDDLFQVARNAPAGKEQDTYDAVKQRAMQYAQTLPKGYSDLLLQEIGKAPAGYNPDWLDNEHAFLRTSQDLSEAALKKSQTFEAQQKGVQAGAEATKAGAETQKINMSDEMLSALAAKGGRESLEAQAVINFRAKQKAASAGQVAGAEAGAKFPYELQLKQQELAQNPVFAVNPKTKQRELTTVADAKAGGYSNPIKASQQDVEKEAQLTSQVNDMQLNQSRYRMAINNMGELSSMDKERMTRILADKVTSGYVLGALPINSFLEQIQAGDKASAWNGLSPDKQAALIGYLRMKNTGLLAQKVLTGMGRASKEALDIELANMPSPIEPKDVASQKLDAWQQNIDQMSSRAVKLPWMESPQDVKARIEIPPTPQAPRTTGQYRGKPSQDTGRKAYQVGMPVEGIPGKVGKTVSKVYPDGTFDVQ